MLLDVFEEVAVFVAGQLPEKLPPKDDLVVLKELIEAGKLTPVVERTYPLSETAAAIRYLEGGHARAKVVITV